MALQKCFIEELGFRYDIREIIRHELKTSMSSDVIMLNLLLKEKFGVLNLKQKEVLKNIISSEGGSLLILNNYLNCSEYLNLAYEKCDIKLILQSAINDLNAIFGDKRQKTFIDCICEDCFLDVNKREINRLFYNLIVNLSEFSDYDSENVISIRKNKNFIEMFFRNKTYKTDFFKNNKFRKTSINMSFDVCKKIVKLHNGILKINPFKNPKYAYKISFSIAK